MTGRQLYEYALIEINKVEAPSLLLEDYNYYLNKAVLQYVNKRYNLYDMNQQTTDDLSVLTGTAIVTNVTKKTGNMLQGAVYTGELPQDYYHLLSCVAVFTPTRNFGCYKVTDPIFIGAKRLTASMWTQIINNYYLKPDVKNPYYYIHNDNTPVIDSNTGNQEYVDGQRDGLHSPLTIEIRYGKDSSLFILTGIQVDYLKVPRYIKLTQEIIDSVEDTSSVIEFPDYVCHEIIKELVALLMENASDPRLNTNQPINQAIAPPHQIQQAIAAQRANGG